MSNSLLQIGKKESLNHQIEARQRIIAGLSWDAREEEKVGLFRRVKGDSQHDLDIQCYIYNKDKEFLDFVGAEAQDSMDQSETIYHSGDDQNGTGDGDDEFISAELARMPKAIHGLVFMVEIQSNHFFTDVTAPFTRLADGYNDQNLIEMPIIGSKAENSQAFVMCAIQRNSSSPTGWIAHNISDFPDISRIDNWGNYLSQYIS